jgi:hypothetical protein
MFGYLEELQLIIPDVLNSSVGGHMVISARIPPQGFLPPMHANIGYSSEKGIQVHAYTIHGDGY